MKSESGETETMAASIIAVAKAMEKFGNLLPQMRNEAFVVDPGLGPACAKAGGNWLDVAAARELASGKVQRS